MDIDGIFSISSFNCDIGFTRRAIFIFRVQLGPEFLSGKRSFSVISSASSRRLSGSVVVPSEQSCLESFTWKRTRETVVKSPALELCRSWVQRTPAVPPPPVAGSWGCGWGRWRSPPTQAHWSCTWSGGGVRTNVKTSVPCYKESADLSSHLAVFRLVSHSKLDKRTGIAGHLLTRLQNRKRFYSLGRALPRDTLAMLSRKYVKVVRFSNRDHWFVVLNIKAKPVGH